MYFKFLLFFKKKLIIIKIVDFGASPSKKFINTKLATYAENLYENAEVKVLVLNDFQMPIYTAWTEKQLGKLELAKVFLDKIASTDI